MTSMELFEYIAFAVMYLLILGKGPRSSKFINPNLVYDEEHGSSRIMDNPHVPCVGLLPSRPVHVLYITQISSQFHPENII